jgi:hypothetical protein
MTERYSSLWILYRGRCRGSSTTTRGTCSSAKRMVLIPLWHHLQRNTVQRGARHRKGYDSIRMIEKGVDGCRSGKSESSEHARRGR